MVGISESHVEETAGAARFRIAKRGDELAGPERRVGAINNQIKAWPDRHSTRYKGSLRNPLCSARGGSPHFFAFMATDESGWASRLATMSFVVAAYFLKWSVCRCASNAAALS